MRNATIAPRPRQQPRPPIWFGAWAEAAIRRAARWGDAWLAGPSASLAELMPSANMYRKACGENGKGEGEIALFRYVFVAASKQKAIAAAGASFIHAFDRMYFRWPHPVVKRPTGKLSIERLAEDRIILGDPQTCIEELARFRSALNVRHLVCRFSVPGIAREACEESFQLFGWEVMPALRRDG